MMIITNKLGNYLAITLGAGAAATSAEGATTVTLYGQGVTPPAGINPGRETAFPEPFYLDASGYANGSFFAQSGSKINGITVNHFFTQGNDLLNQDYANASATFYGLANVGAEVGSANYANISLNGNDAIYEAVGQFQITNYGIHLIALAKQSDNRALSISAGKTAIDGSAISAVPEVSSHLALLALGSAGVLTRRRLKRAA